MSLRAVTAHFVVGLCLRDGRIPDDVKGIPIGANEFDTAKLAVERSVIHPFFRVPRERLGERDRPRGLVVEARLHVTTVLWVNVVTIVSWYGAVIFPCAGMTTESRMTPFSIA